MKFELGINYWPRRSAMYMWREFDIGEIRADMAHIAAMGFDVVRVFVLMQDFLPQPTRVDVKMVGRLVQVAGAASDAGLRIVPTLIVLNMSGHIWWPEWMIGAAGTPRDLFGDADMLAAQALLAATCADALAGEHAIRAFDLTNEIDDAQRPASRAAARLWMRRLADSVRGAASGTPIQIGAHLPSLSTANHMRVDDIAAAVDEDTMHAYPLYTDVARSFLDPELVPFACALTSGLTGNGRRTLMQEFGLCTAPRHQPGHTITDDFLGQPRLQYLASEEEAAVYYEAVLKALVATGAAGAYAWCYGDYHAQLFARPPLTTAMRERTFGVVRADGTAKPAAEAFRYLRRQRDQGMLPQVPVPAILDMSADEYYSEPARHFARLYQRWIAQRS